VGPIARMRMYDTLTPYSKFCLQNRRFSYKTKLLTRCVYDELQLLQQPIFDLHHRINQIHILPSYFLNIHFNIILSFKILIDKHKGKDYVGYLDTNMNMI
jgi:hypothetical protein